MVLSLPMLLLGLVGAGMRKRPQILPNRTLVTDTGVPFRGPAWSKCFLRGGNRNNISEADVASLMAYKHTPFNALHVYHDAPGCKTGGMELEELDNIVEWAGKHGVYVVIVAAGDTFDNQWKKWWPVLAPRYAKQTHVVYEMINEPHEFNTHDMIAWNASIKAMATAYEAIKKAAPETLVLLPTLSMLNEHSYERILYGDRKNYPDGIPRNPFAGGLNDALTGEKIDQSGTILSYHTYDGDEFPRVGKSLDVVQGLGWATIDTEVPTNQTGSCNLACCCNVNPKWIVHGACSTSVNKTVEYERRSQSWLSFVSVLNVSESLAKPLMAAGLSWHDPYNTRRSATISIDE